jgi:hypothetical protein
MIHGIYEHTAAVHRMVSEMFELGSAPCCPVDQHCASPGVRDLSRLTAEQLADHSLQHPAPPLPNEPAAKNSPAYCQPAPRQQQPNRGRPAQHAARGLYKSGYLSTVASEPQSRQANTSQVVRRPSSKKPPQPASERTGPAKRGPVLATALDKQLLSSKKMAEMYKRSARPSRPALQSGPACQLLTGREAVSLPVQAELSPASNKLSADELTFIVDDEMYLRDKRGSLVRDDEGRSIHLTHGQWQRLLESRAAGEAGAE